jgi:hypothetical protein
MVRRLSRRFPGVPLTALGQTIFWDEPMKAVLLDSLENDAPGTRLRLSVMDTDYFAKPPLETEGAGEYALLPHNDGSTKDLWVATGELSRLFGSETVPTREMYHRHGVRLEQIAGASAENSLRFLDRMTEAWGWLGLAHTGSRRTLAGEIPLSGALPKLLEQLEWGFRSTADALVDPEDRRKATEILEAWLQEVREYASSHPDNSLTDLYQFLLPGLTAALESSESRRPSPALETGSSMEQFRFHRRTADRPEFELLDLFLRPETREAACAAYNDAVRGSDIYPLDRFAPGAIPFDLVIPGRGRGTIRLLPERVIVELEERVYLRIARPIESAGDLADAIETHLGPGTSLVGKAVTLIAMLARTSLVVLNETGSNYVWRTRNMIDGLCRRGVSYEVYPIVRLRYPTWDSFGVTGRTVRLPEHLAQAFRTETIRAEELSLRWREVCQNSRALLSEAADSIGPREVMEFLSRRQGEIWEERRREYEACKLQLLDLQKRLNAIHEASVTLHSETRRLKADCDALQKRKGEDFRRTIQPLREAMRNVGVKDFRALYGSFSAEEREGLSHEAREAYDRLLAEMERRRSFDAEWDSLRSAIQERVHRLREWEQERQSLLTDERIQSIRRRIAVLTLEAHTAKLEWVRNAYLTAEELEHTDYRPSAWWLILLSPDGRWFRRLKETTKVYLEPLSCRPPQRAGDPAAEEEREPIVCADCRR